MFESIEEACLHMQKLILKEWLDVIESLRTLSHQVEQKNYLLLEHNETIEHIASGIANLHALQMDYQERQNDVDNQIAEMKSMIDLD